MGFPTGIFIDATKGVPVDNNIPSGLFIQNTIVAGCPTPVRYALSPNTAVPNTPHTSATITAWFNTAAYGNSILTNNTEVGLIAPFNYNAPDFNPSSATSAAAAGATFSNPKLSTGFTSVSYKGACAVGDTWWKGWSKF